MSELEGKRWWARPPIMRRSRWVLALICVLVCSVSFGLNREGSIRDLRHTAWGPKEGAPDAIQSLAQTNDGYLWMGNGAGLYRFDGLHFEHVELPRSDRVYSPNVYVLFAPSSGGLWLGFTYGGAGFLKDGHLTAFDERDGLPKASVVDFAQDLDGTIWTATWKGVSRLDGSRWRSMGPSDGYTDVMSEQLLVDSEGTLWAASRNKVFFLPRGATTFREAAAQPHPDATRFTPSGLAETFDGAVWFLYNDELLLLHKNKPSGHGRSSGFGTLVDRDGTLWFDRHAKLQRIPHPESLSGPIWNPPEDLTDSFSEKDGVVSGLGYPPILEDKEGNLWFTSFAGLDRLSESNVNRVSPPANSSGPTLPAQPALAAGDQGALWVASTHSALLYLKDGKLERSKDIGFSSAALRADDGTVWFGYTNDLWKNSSGVFEHVSAPENKEARYIWSMTQDAVGRLWMSVQGRGVYRMTNGAWSRPTDIASMRTDTPTILSTDNRGRVWFGYVKGEVAVLDGNNLRNFTGRERLPIGHVTAIYGKRGRVWLGGEFGLALYDRDKFHEVKPQEGYAFNNLTGIIETAQGDLWLNTSTGIACIEASEIRRLTQDPDYRVRARVFDVLDGVEGSSARSLPVPTAIEGTDGRLWFSTTLGLYSIDPKTLHRNLVPPPVFIRSVSVGDATYAPSDGLRLPKRTTSIRIDYVAPSLTMAEKVRYRYKLEGVDAEWQDAQTRRQAFYTNLGPGPHRFHIAAANNDGVWNEVGATLVFDIPPTFVQTRGFIAICLLTAALALWSLMHLRLRRTSARLLARYQTLTDERERIARELHDTLLQSTQALILQFQGAANELAADTSTRQKLRIALDRADKVMEEGRDRVLDLRTSATVFDNLSQALTAVGEELAAIYSIAFTSILEGSQRSLVPQVGDEVYRIEREALLNAFRHSQAKAIELQCIFGASQLRLRVRDDGVGMSSTIAASGAHPGHWGVKGMRERAEKIGGKLDMWSRAGAGTEIEFSISASLAYQQDTLLGAWAILRKWIEQLFQMRRQGANK
jgi:signal transduction histidine kinase/ligand-binding sensor domain-containing protein